MQNFDAGVGEKFFLLFSVTDLVNVPESYIVFEVSQFDSYSYLFNNPRYISLDSNVTPDGIPLTGMRIGVNGAEVNISVVDGQIMDSQLVTETIQRIFQRHRLKPSSPVATALSGHHVIVKRISLPQMSEAELGLLLQASGRRGNVANPPDAGGN